MVTVEDLQESSGSDLHLVKVELDYHTWDAAYTPIGRLTFESNGNTYLNVHVAKIQKDALGVAPKKVVIFNFALNDALLAAFEFYQSSGDLGPWLECGA